MAAPLRVGIVGTGFGRRVAAPAFAAVDGCVVVDVVSARDDAAVRGLCARRDLDLVGVHSPPFLHRAHVGHAVAAGHAVLCDKPFGRGVDDAVAMLAAAEAEGVVHIVDFEFRADPVRESLRGLVAGGSLGTVEHVAWTHLSAGSRQPLREHGWLFERSAGGGWIGAWASHAVDALRWLLADELAVVAAATRTDVRERPDATGVLHACDAEDGFAALLRSTGGVTITIDSSFAAVAPVAPRLVVQGSEAVAELVADSRLTVRRADGSRDETAPEPVPPGTDPHEVPMRRFAARVCAAVRAGRAPEGLPTFADGLACRTVLDRLRG